MAAIDLTTVPLVREWIPSPTGTPSTQIVAQQTSILQAAITAASLDFMRRTGYGAADGTLPSQSPFVQAVDYSETYDGNGNDRKFLRSRPIISVQSLTVDGMTIPSSPGYPNPGYRIDGDGKSIVLIGSSGGYLGRTCGYRFTRGRQNVAITYTAGFAAQNIVNELQTVPANPGPYTVLTSLPWLADAGVKYFSNGNPFTQVQTAPAAGQYYLNGNTYLFNASDAGEQIQISYTAAGTPADIELAVRRMVFLIYQRRSWEGLRSIAKPELGQTTYSAWEIDPSVQEVIGNYFRVAVV
jgi:hypothetical protein